ncbi:MAG: C69 family dipeptidase [Treponema sp.]|nr:C69 family dipeptidase [Treponema sp.]
MSCTTILAGKNATYNGATFISRTEDCPSGQFCEKKFVVVNPKDQPKKYKTILSKQEIDLPDNPMRYTSTPNADKKEGIWAAHGINEANVAMTATETITSNERVLGADPLTKKCGIGEEDLNVITLPYIHSAREGVERLGMLLEKYGTYEMNGIAFSDQDEIWWLETIGGHHWMAKRVPDDAYVVMPNQLGIDSFDFDDAYGAKKNYMCCQDLRDFVDRNHLDLTQEGKSFNPREAFGSHDDADHVYNTPRAWFILRYLNPTSAKWDGPDADYKPTSDNLPWSMVPERKITIEDMKYLLSSHYNGTEFDPYASYGKTENRGAYRSIGINRNCCSCILEIRGYMPDSCKGLQWLSFASNAFNVMPPLYTNITKCPKYISYVPKNVSTDSFYWASRLISALSDAGYSKNLNHIEHYQMEVGSKSHEILNKYDKEIAGLEGQSAIEMCQKANEEIFKMVKEETNKTLGQVLFEASNLMKNSYARSDH